MSSPDLKLTLKKPKINYKFSTVAEHALLQLKNVPKTPARAYCFEASRGDARRCKGERPSKWREGPPRGRENRGQGRIPASISRSNAPRNRTNRRRKLVAGVLATAVAVKDYAVAGTQKFGRVFQRLNRAVGLQVAAHVVSHDFSTVNVHRQEKVQETSMRADVYWFVLSFWGRGRLVRILKC